MYDESVGVYKNNNSDWKPIMDSLDVHLDIDNIDGKRYYYIRNKNKNIEEFDLKKAKKGQYQVKIVIDIKSGKLENVDFGKQAGGRITIDKITKIQKSINIYKKENGKVSYGRIAPIRDISTILSLVKEYYYCETTITFEQNYNPHKMGVIKDSGILDRDGVVEEINKSGIRFLCFTEDENSNPQTKRDRFNKIAWKAIEEDSIECVSVMYSLLEISPPPPPPLPLSTSSSSLISSVPSAPLPPPLPSSQISPQQHSSNLKTPHSRHSIVAMAYKEDKGGKIIIKTFDSSGVSYNAGRFFLDFIDFKRVDDLKITTQRIQRGTKCSYYSEGDLIVVFKKHLQKEKITKEHLIDQGKWDKEVLKEIIFVVGHEKINTIKIQLQNTTNISKDEYDNFIESIYRCCLMNTIVGKQVEIKSEQIQEINQQQKNSKEDLVVQNNSKNKTPTDLPQSTSSGGEEAASVEEAPEEQVKKQMQNVFSELLGKMEVSDVSLTTPSSQPTQPDISQIPLEQSTMPRSK